MNVLGEDEISVGCYVMCFNFSTWLLIVIILNVDMNRDRMISDELRAIETRLVGEMPRDFDIVMSEIEWEDVALV